MITLLLSLTLFGHAAIDTAPQALTQMHGRMDTGRTHYVQADMSLRPQGALNMPGNLQSNEYQRWWNRIVTTAASTGAAQ